VLANAEICLLNTVLLFLSQPSDFLLKQSILLLSSAVLSFTLHLSSSSEFFDGRFSELRRHG
jgi:hypothetical protein